LRKPKKIKRQRQNAIDDRYFENQQDHHRINGRVGYAGFGILEDTVKRLHGKERRKLHGAKDKKIFRTLRASPR
jgi:hypothetical protein